MHKSVLFFLFSLSFSHMVFAFKKDGHLLIEKKAYHALKAEKANNVLPSGLAIYNKLHEKDILLTGQSFNSARPDLDFTRQFLADKQVFHFMASPQAVKLAMKESSREKKKMSLVKTSLPICLKMIYVMSREIIDNPVGALQAGRGTYVLIHAITDSYSKDHVTRSPGTNEIECIKSWELSKLFWGDSAKVVENGIPNAEADRLEFLHTSAGEADFEWEDKGGDLTSNGKEAIKAIKDLLIMLYLGSENKAQADQLIVAYIEKYFVPNGAKLVKHRFIFAPKLTDQLSADYDTIDVSYSNVYDDPNAQVRAIEFDRYTRHSLTLGCQNIFNELGPRSFSFEYGFTFTPGSASGKNSWRKRIPVGYYASISENISKFPELKFYETMQLQLSVKPQLFLPLIGNLMVQPKVGYGFAPLVGNNMTHSLILGVDLTWNLFADYGRSGSSTKRLRTTLFYEFDSASLPSSHSIGLRLGFNTWQGRVIKKRYKNP